MLRATPCDDTALGYRGMLQAQELALQAYASSRRNCRLGSADPVCLFAASGLGPGALREGVRRFANVHARAPECLDVISVMFDKF